MKFPTRFYPNRAGEPPPFNFQLSLGHRRLNPGRYVGVAEREADNFAFLDRLEELNEELEALSAEGGELEARIADNVAKILSVN